MRISSQTLYTESVQQMQQIQSRLHKTQSSISSGKKYQSAADNPIEYTKGLQILGQIQTQNQYIKNRDYSLKQAQEVETALRSSIGLIQNTKELLIQLKNPTLNTSDKNVIQNQVQSNYQNLLALANTQTNDGKYLFNGTQGTTKPFVLSNNAVAYQGDQSKQNTYLASGVSASLNVTGNELWMQIKNGNGNFQVNTGNNTGNAQWSDLTNTTVGNDWNKYEIKFTTTTEYSIVNVSQPLLPVTVSAGNLYQSGNVININGKQLILTGAPAIGDSFTVQPSQNKSVFDTLNQISTTIGKPNNTEYQQGIYEAQTHLSNIEQHFLTYLTSNGTQQAAIENFDDQGKNNIAMLKEQYSRIMDTDYNEAISRLAQEQFTLTAAQKTYAQFSQMSIFNYI